MNGGRYALDRLTWPEVRQVLGEDSRLLLPVGSLEQHGPHLPLGTNTFIAETLARDLSDDCGILLAPTLAYGVVRGASGTFAGVAGLRRKTLHRTVNELLAGWEDHGVSEFVLITAFRYEPHVDALLMALTESSTTTVIDLYLVDVSDLLESRAAIEHGGELETSLMLHLAPELVRSEHIADEPAAAHAPQRSYTQGWVPTPRPGGSGVTGIPSRASAIKGREIYTRYRAAVRAALARP